MRKSEKVNNFLPDSNHGGSKLFTFLPFNFFLSSYGL